MRLKNPVDLNKIINDFNSGISEELIAKKHKIGKYVVKSIILKNQDPEKYKNYSAEKNRKNQEMDELLLKKVIDKLKDGIEKKYIKESLNISTYKLNALLKITNKKTKAENRYDFNTVLELVKMGKKRDTIIQELTPDKTPHYFNIWRNSIPKELNNQLSRFLHKKKFTTHKLKEVKIEKKFTYKETNANTILPMGLK